MTVRKHPILTVLGILTVIAILLSTLVAIILHMFGSPASISFSEKIGVIPIDGVISDSFSITSQLVTFRKDNGIKAIILKINSPGGSVGPTQEIFKEVMRTSKTKKVIASMGGVAASGGYYIAAAADKIVANPGTITGSIGVLMEFVRFQELLGKIGVNMEVLKSGQFKDIGSPHREMTDREREIINSLINDIQSQFVDAVAKGRDLPVEKVLEIADGRIFSGAQAKELGLVDALGNFHDSVDIAKNMAGIKGEAELVYPKKSGRALWDVFLEETAGSLIGLIKDIDTTAEYRWGGFAGNKTTENH